MWGKPTAGTSETFRGDWGDAAFDVGDVTDRPVVSRRNRSTGTRPNQEIELELQVHPCPQCGLNVKIGMTLLSVGPWSSLSARERNARPYPASHVPGRPVVGERRRSFLSNPDGSGMAVAASSLQPGLGEGVGSLCAINTGEIASLNYRKLALISSCVRQKNYLFRRGHSRDCICGGVVRE